MMALLVSGIVSAYAKEPEATAETPPQSQQNTKLEDTGKKAGEIVSQPVRDVGITRTDIPPILIKASEDPYNLASIKSCKDIAAEITELNAVLGPDFVVGNSKKENRAGKLAEAGGKTVINAFIPFRGLVREITGAAPAERRLDAAIEAGFARRGFLRGAHHTRGCRTIFSSGNRPLSSSQ